MTILEDTVYLYSMNDLYYKNRPSGNPMAIKKAVYTGQNSLYQSMWIDRLIVSLYVMLSSTLLVISIGIILGISG